MPCDSAGLGGAFAPVGKRQARIHAKWAALPVTSVRPVSIAVAATMRSASFRGCPPAPASAHKPAVRVSTGTETGRTSLLSTSLRNSFNAWTARRRSPRRIS